MCLDGDGNGSEWKDLVRGEHGVMRGRDVDEKTREDGLVWVAASEE